MIKVIHLMVVDWYEAVGIILFLSFVDCIDGLNDASFQHLVDRGSRQSLRNEFGR